MCQQRQNAIFEYTRATCDKVHHTIFVDKNHVRIATMLRKSDYKEAFPRRGGQRAKEGKAHFRES